MKTTADQLAEDPTWQRVREVGDHLMSFSGLSYRGRFIDLEDWKGVHVMEFGDKNATPIVLLHGSGTGGSVWHRQIEALSKDLRVIVPDLPLFGLSMIPSRIPEIPGEASRIVIDLMDTLEIQNAHIAGLSLGGLFCLGAVVQAPDRFRKVLLAASAGLGHDLPFALRAAGLPLIGNIIARPPRWLLSQFFDHKDAQHSNPSPERDALKLQQYSLTRRRGRSPMFQEGIRRFATFMHGQRHVFDDQSLAEIRNPTLIAAGGDDRFFPLAHHERAASLIPNARLEIVPQCGHLMAIEAPETLTLLLQEWFIE